MRYIVPLLLVLLSPVAIGAEPVFSSTALAPSEYMLSKLEQHPVVIVGEAHWIRHDVQLVAGLVPALAERRTVLAMETLQAEDQAALDALLGAPEWNATEALRLHRSAAWPYREYLEILRAAWAANRAAEGSMRIVAIGPDHDFRAKKISYEGFMAERVAQEVDAGRRVLVYCGAHHAFTRYHQPELDSAGKARAFIDRMGNILWRQYGERVFLITLHRPLWCGKEPWDYCLPLDGAIDCAGAALGRAVGFDVAGTSLGALPIGSAAYYARGYATLRLDEMTDGYVWFGPIEDYQDVQLIPLDEFAPDPAALEHVAARNPFSNEAGATRERLEALWKAQAERRADPLTSRRWKPLVGWRERCVP